MAAAYVSCITMLCASPALAADKSPLRILYAGNVGTPREKDFVDFLRAEFIAVQTVALTAFSPRDSDRFDVTIFDWARIQDPHATGLNIPQVNIDRDFKRAALLVGGIGGRIGGNLGLKLDWL